MEIFHKKIEDEFLFLFKFNMIAKTSKFIFSALLSSWVFFTANYYLLIATVKVEGACRCS